MLVASDYTRKEIEQIHLAYEDMLDSINSDLTEEDFINIFDAYNWALNKHSKQRRKSGEPYIFHPIAVAKICASEIELGPTAIIAALLHDIVEDTNVTIEEIGERFGDKIQIIVDGLTKLDGSVNKDNPQAENFKKVLSTLVEDVRVVLIKMADRLHNLRTIASMPKHKQLKIAAETMYVYAPLAHRLGLYAVKEEFQDTCMKLTDPEPYFEIARKLQETLKSRNEYIATFIDPVSELLDDLKIKYRILGRPKSIYSVWNKIKTKHVEFEEIYDLFAIRIIVDVPVKLEKIVCYQVYAVVSDIFTPIPERLKDWITNPKSNGYESLHTTVVGPEGKFVEVQIRSERMNQIAEMGFAAHWKYKGISKSENVYDKWLDGVRDLLDNNQNDAVQFLTDFKTNLFQEEVYVYTPKGDLKVLPKGATALDFAFSIHSQVGYHCTSVKVNRKLVPMGHVLENGDKIEVITNQKQKPNESWLKLVITGKAKSKIRSSMKEEKRIKGDSGKETLLRKLKQIKAGYEENIDKIVKFYEFNSRVDLFYAIAQGNVKLRQVRALEVVGGKIIFEDKRANQKEAPSIESPKEVYSPQSSKTQLIINGESGDQYKYSFANCCNPVNGDYIFAFLTTTEGMKIHRTTCPNATNLLANYGYRVLSAEWVSTKFSSFEAELKITGIDTGIGVIETISQALSKELGINLSSFHIDAKQGYFEATLVLEVIHLDELNHSIKTLKDLSMVATVSRIK